MSFCYVNKLEYVPMASMRRRALYASRIWRSTSSAHLKSLSTSLKTFKFEWPVKPAFGLLQIYITNLKKIVRQNSCSNIINVSSKKFTTKQWLGSLCFCRKFSPWHMDPVITPLTPTMRWAIEGKDIHAMLPCLMQHMGHPSLESAYCCIHLAPDCFAQCPAPASSMECLMPEVEGYGI